MRVCWFGGIYKGNGLLEFPRGGDEAGFVTHSFTITYVLAKYKVTDSDIKDIVLYAFQNDKYPEELDEYPAMIDWIFFKADMLRTINAVADPLDVNGYNVNDKDLHKFQFLVRELCAFPNNAKTPLVDINKAREMYKFNWEFLDRHVFEEPANYIDEIISVISREYMTSSSKTSAFYISCGMAAELISYAKESSLIPAGLRAKMIPHYNPLVIDKDSSDVKWRNYLANWSKLTLTCKLLITAISVNRIFESYYSRCVSSDNFKYIGHYILNVDNEEVRILSILLIRSLIERF